MSRATRATILVAALAAGCTAPNYGNGHLQCGSNRSCPSGFYCADDEHCWLDGSGPSAGDPDGGVADLAVPSTDNLAGVVVDMSGGIDLGGGPTHCSTMNIHPLLCEGFETALNMSPNGWQQSTTNGTTTVDTTRAFRGASSFKSHISGSAANTSPHATIGTIKPFPIIGVLYARVWVYFSPSLPSDFEQFMNFTDSGSTGISVASDSGKMTLDDYAAPAVYKLSATKLPLDRWACVTFMMSQGATTGAISIGLDGKALNDLTLTGPTPTAVRVLLGMDFDSNNNAIPAYDAWFDELVVDDSPVSCTD